MLDFWGGKLYEPGSKLVVLGMVIPPLIGNPYNGYINPYYWADDHPLLYGNNGCLDPGTCANKFGMRGKRLPGVQSPPKITLPKTNMATEKWW